jgi:hypothetical protein
VPQNKPKSHRTDLDRSDYERLGQDLELLVATGYAGKRRLMWANFLRGLFFGLGTTVGVSLTVALVLYLLSITEEVWFLERISQNLEQTLNR